MVVQYSHGDITNFTIAGESVAVIFKSFDGYVLRFQKEISEEHKKYILDQYEQIKDKSDGQYKFDNCAHRSDNKITGLVPTCCSLINIEGYQCHKIGIFNVTPTQCGPCTEFQQK